MIGFNCVHWVSSGLTADAGIYGVRPDGRQVHPGFTWVRPGLGVHSWGSSVSSGVVGYIRRVSSGVAWVRPGCRRVHPGSLICALVVIGFILVQWGAPWGSSGSSRVRPWVRRKHPMSQGSLGCALWVVWCRGGAPWGSFRVGVFSGVRPVDR